jgi:hypothetical protein
VYKRPALPICLITVPGLAVHAAEPLGYWPLDGLVESGGGDYFWRVDEVEADGTVHRGSVWKSTVPGYLIVDDFESYNDAEEGTGTRLYEVWIDGVSNGSTSYVGYEFPSGGTFGARTIVHGKG